MRLIKKFLLATTFVFVNSAFAADNSIYIDQTGNNATITILQEGAQNTVKGIGGADLALPSLIVGDAISVNVQQIGSGNNLELGINTTTANGSEPTTVSYTVTGNNAQAIINLNNLGESVNASTTLAITQTGNYTFTDVNILGSNNLMNINQTGNYNKIMASVSANATTVNVNQSGGSGNETTLTLTGNNGIVDITTVGALNITSVNQSGGGVLGHYLNMSLTGSSNTTTIVQSGMTDSSINFTSVGSNNVFSFVSAGSLGVK